MSGADTADAHSLLQEKLSCKNLQKKGRKAQGREERVVIGETPEYSFVAVSSRVKAVHLREERLRHMIERRKWSNRSLIWRCNNKLSRIG